MKAYTDLEQSKKLAEILPLESADMYWKNGVSDKYIQCFTPFVIDEDATNVNFDYDTPCWSLAALINVIDTNYYTTLYHDGVAWNIDIIHHDNVKDKHSVYDNTPIDACVAMIEKLHEQKLL